MFGMNSLTPGRLIKYGALAYASQYLARRGFNRYRQTQETKQRSLRNDQVVDTASKDSFPASDPPAYSSSTVGPIS